MASVLELSDKLGHRYLSARQIAEGPLSELIPRVEALPANAHPAAPTTQALLGGLPPESIAVSRLFSEYEQILTVENRSKTAEQYRVWKTARQRAVANFIEAVGDMAIDEINYDHARRWRTWHSDRVLAGKIKAESANKDFSNFSAMLNRVLDEKQLPNTRPFSGIRVKGAKMTIYDTRPPIPDELIRNIILHEARMSGLNAEARDVLFVMLNTWARPSEIVGLLPKHIHLDAPIPFIQIREEGRQVKTASSIRDIPLVGVSLDAMRRHPNGFPAYFGRATAWGNLVNKYLRNAGLPKPLTAYGLRHAFSDRLVDAEFSQRVIDDAMGHSLRGQR